MPEDGEKEEGEEEKAEEEKEKDEGEEEDGEKDGTGDEDGLEDGDEDDEKCIVDVFACECGSDVGKETWFEMDGRGRGETAAKEEDAGGEAEAEAS
jgi:hypothetical protein